MKKTLYDIVTKLENTYGVELSSDKLELIDDVILFVLEEEISFVDFYKSVEEMAKQQKGIIEFKDAKTALKLAGKTTQLKREETK